jgi:hypothetical protein
MKNSINSIEVWRQSIFEQSTLGQLYINGEYVGYTCEDTLRPDRIKLKHETAIEEGKYSSRKYNSSTFKECIAIDDVPNFEHIRIHGGNTHKNSSGCVLLGLSKDPVDGTISNCRPAMDKLYDMIDDSKPIYVTIINQIGMK